MALRHSENKSKKRTERKNNIKEFSYKIFRFSKKKTQNKNENKIELIKVAGGRGEILKNGNVIMTYRKNFGENDNQEDVIVAYIYSSDIFKKLGYKKKVNINQEYDQKANIVLKEKVNAYRKTKELLVIITLNLDDVLIESIVKNSKGEILKKDFVNVVLGSYNKIKEITNKNRIFEIEKNKLYIVA